MTKTIDNINIAGIRPGLPISAADTLAMATGLGAFAANYAMAGGNKGHAMQGVVAVNQQGGNRQITGAGAWIRCLSTVTAGSWSALEIFDADFLCAEIRLHVRFASRAVPRSGQGVMCTNAHLPLGQNQNGWVRFVSYNTPARVRVGRGGAPRGVAPPKL